MVGVFPSKGSIVSRNREPYYTAERFSLSPREADVLRLLVAGESTAQIQDTLCIAPGTFNYHMRNIYTKLGVHSRQELLVFIYNSRNNSGTPL